jgi:predicted ATPase
MQDAALFAELLSLPNDGRYPALELVPQQRRQRTLEALTSQVAALARQNPVLMIFEDAHWIDPTSLETLGRIMNQIRSLPVLLILTFRPEFNAPWVGRSRVTNLTLNRFGEGEVAALIARLVGNKELPTDVMAEIAERTDGIPLFVEEMTKAVLEAGTERAAGPLEVSAPLLGLKLIDFGAILPLRHYCRDVSPRSQRGVTRCVGKETRPWRARPCPQER